MTTEPTTDDRTDLRSLPDVTDRRETACQLCESDAIAPGDVFARLLEAYWPEDGHPELLKLKRELEHASGYELRLTVTELKRHMNEHVGYAMTASEGVVL